MTSSQAKKQRRARKKNRPNKGKAKRKQRAHQKAALETRHQTQRPVPTDGLHGGEYRQPEPPEVSIPAPGGDGAVPEEQEAPRGLRRLLRRKR